MNVADVSTKDGMKGRSPWTNRLLPIVLLLWGLSGHASPPPAGVAPLIVPSGGFSIDGDVMANAPVANVGDWLTSTNGTGGGVLNAAGVPLNPTTTFHFIDAYSTTSDLIFAGGLKWTDDPNLWRWVTGKASSKTDINNALLHVATDAGGHSWVVVAADRASTSGESYIDFEFLQNSLVRNNNGAFVSAGSNGGRTTNDLLLSLAFTSGGSVADFLAFRWLPDGSGGFAYVDVTASLPSGGVFVALNSNTIAVPYGAFGQTSYAPLAFAEAALDMTALIGNFDPCVSVGFKTIMVKTKSSSSSSASISDFIDPIQYSLQIGPSASAGPDQTRCTEGDSTAFPLQGQATAGLQPITSTAWSVVSGTATIDSPASLATTAHVFSGTATLRLTVVEANGCTETDDVLLNVAPLPACSITGPSLVCPRGSTQFSGPAGMSAYSWAITGSGAFSGATNAQNVTVASGSVCGTNFTLSLSVTSNGCHSACSADVLVNDTNAPTITRPADITIECPSSPSTNLTGSATAQDGCGFVTVSYSDSVSNNCGGAKLIARTWTATDQCGNQASAVQTITVRDVTPPTITCPANITLECPAAPATNITGVATAQDTCGAVAVTYSDSVSNTCGGSQVISRTWTATDDCGNARSCVQKITLRDTTPPLITCPANVTLECPATPDTNITGVATALDSCSAVAITYTDSVSNRCAGTKVISRTWRAADGCSNSMTCVQTITIVDTTPPAVTAPADTTLECPASPGTNVTGVATAQDGCSSVSMSYSDSVGNICGNAKLISRTWTATDQCGNKASAVQRIMVQDITPPSITAPSNVVLECPAVTTTNATGVAKAADGCGTVSIGFSDSVSNNCGGTEVISRTWTATDQCGNLASAVQTITVRDTTSPSITSPSNLVLECPAVTTTNVTGVATARDTCGSVSISFSDSVSNSCGGTEVIRRTWTATDPCGNQASAVQTITVRDTTPPIIVPPANVVLECPAVTTTNATGVATGFDNCGSVSIGFSDVVTTNCGGTKVIARTWTANDQCGNSASAVQTITVRDTTPPSITAPSDLTLECPAITTTNATGVATAQDGCGSVSISFSDVVSNSCAGAKLISRTWTATDQCGNKASALQTITVRDTIKPTLICPSNVVLECPATNTGTNVTGVATALDGCSAVTISFGDVVTTNCGNTKVIARTWTATDQCGNTTNAVQTITVRDTTPPSISAPTNLVLDCPAITTTNATGVAVASDGCGPVTIGYTDSVSNLCSNAKVISRTWTATDQCGNNRSAVQTITVRDIAAPSITAPGNLVLDCPAVTTTNATGMASASDGCSAVTISFSDSVSNSCGGTKVISRTWTATDPCGNSASALQTITVRDITPPALRLPANLVLQCPGDTRTNVTGAATATDGCGSVSLSYSDVVSNSCGFTKTVWRTWTATDQCGNTTNGLQTITVVDTTKPNITSPNISVQCVGDVPGAYTNLAAFLAAGGTATDPCSAALAFSLTSDSGLVGRCPGKVTRVYRVTDDCGNFADTTQTITVDDTIPPVLTCASNVTVECGASLDPANTGSARATDNCSTNVGITYADTVVQGQYNLNFYVADPDTNTGPYAQTYLQLGPGSLPCPDAAVLTGRALDPLRNAVAYAPSGQLDALTSIGNVPMALGQIVPFEVVIQASGGPGPERGTIDFTAAWNTYTTSNNRFGYDTNYMVYCAFVDAADPGSIDPNNNARVESYSSVVINRGTIAEAIQGTFRVSGLDSGDRVVVEIWVVLDSTMPDHTGGTVAAGLVSAQKASDPPVPLTVGVQTDSLGNLSKITALPPPQQQPPLGPLPPQPPVLPGATVNVINRTWTATDDCGNSSTCVQQITVRDTAPPAIVAPDVVLECPATDTSTNVTGVAVAQDACGGSVKVYYSDVVSNTCSGTKVVFRTWTATDDSGNTTNLVQTIAVRDTTPPTLTAPSDVVLECPAVNTSTNFTGVATATDGCGSATISYSDSVSNTCGSAKVISRTWTATDQCGNQASAVQTITVRDTTPPTIAAPGNLILECPAVTTTNVTGIATAHDGCGSVTISFSDSVSNTCGAAAVISRTWTATDQCGNKASALQTITVRDTTPPTLTCQPDKTVSLGQAWSFDQPLAADTCGTAKVEVVSTTTNVLSQTTVAVTRTWKATDACGNVATCQQTVTIQDNTPLTPPTILTQPQSQDLSYGDSATLSVAATGSSPLACQWQVNGTDLAGATDGSLTLTNLQFTNAGLYCVVITNAAGKVTSSIAVLNVGPRLITRAVPGGVRLTWSGPFILQWASSPSGLYTDVPGATSPYFYDTSRYPLRFFRLRAQPFRLSVSRLSGGRLSLSGDGVPGCNFILQASTNLLTWENLQTNTSPCVFVDTAAGQYPQRFYRVVLAGTGMDVLPLTPPSITAQPGAQTVFWGSDATLRVAAFGSEPLTYQWRLNETDIGGATASSLTLHSVQLSDSGAYSVLIANPAGTAVSSEAVVDVVPKLYTQASPGGLTMTWAGPFVLQWATSPAGPYTDVPRATSPYFYSSASGKQEFFRLRQ